MTRVFAALIAGAVIGVAVFFFLRTEPARFEGAPSPAPQLAQPNAVSPASSSRVFVSPTHPGLIVSLTRSGVKEAQARIELSRAARSIASGELTWLQAGSETSDAEGRAEFPVLAGRYYVSIKASDGTRAVELVDVSRSDGPTFLEVALKPASSFSGQVVDKATRRPLSGALVRADPQPDEEHVEVTIPAASTLADSLGRFSLDLPSQRWRLEARASGYLANAIVVNESAKDATIELTRGAELSGLVVDAAGQPVADVTVRVTPGDVSSLTSDREGRFSLTVPHAPISLHALAPDGRQGLARVTLQEKQETAQVKLVVADGTELTGLVRDEAGPVAHADVRILAEPEALEVASFDTGPDGRFAAKGLPPGRYSVRAQVGLARRASAVGLELPGAEPVELVLASSGHVVGVVNDGAGVPAEGANVTLRWPRQLGEVRRTARTGSDGRFEFDDVLPSEVFVQATYDDLVSEEVDQYVGPGATVEFVLVTAPQGRLFATVTGAAIDKLVVRQEHRGNEFLEMDKKGRGYEQLLPPGTYHVYAELHPGKGGHDFRFIETQMAEVRAGELTTITVEVPTDQEGASAIPGHKNFNMHPELGSGISFENSPGGVRVDFLMADCPAAVAGVKLGDLVMAIDGEATRDALDAFARVRKPSDGTTMDFLVRREGQDLKLTLR